MLPRLLVLGVVALLAAWPASRAAAGPYRLVDEDGVTHLTDTPNDPRYRAMSGFSATEAGWLKVPEATRKGPAFGGAIRETAERYGVSPSLVEAVIRVESAFNPWAVSSKGAQGLMQLMPRTAYALGVRDSFNPLQNIEGGVRHLRRLLDRYPGNTAFALAAYNAGEGAVDQYRGIPPYQETRQYVRKVLEHSGIAAAPAAEPAPAAPPQLIYRYEDADGTVTFSNLPAVTVKK